MRRLLLVLLAACAAPAKHQPATSKNVLTHASEAWCPDDFESGPSDTCFAIPKAAPKDASIVLYLHGPLRGRGSAQEWKAVHAAVERGFAVVLARGRRDQCAWSKDSKDQFCWPQDPGDTPTITSVVGEWDKVLWQTEALLEPGTHRRYVLGFAEGSSFAGLIATQHLFQAQAFALVGGALVAPIEKPEKKAKAPPLLLGFDQDVEKTKELHEALSKAQWPHAYCPRAGSGTRIDTEDVESALRFFKRDAEGAFKSGAIACEVGKR